MFYKTGLLSRGLTIERGLTFQYLRYILRVAEINFCSESNIDPEQILANFTHPIAKVKVVYLANKARNVPLTIHGLHGPVCDGLLTAFAFGQNSIGVALFAKSLAFILVEAHLSCGKV